jgi:spore germination protein
MHIKRIALLAILSGIVLTTGCSPFVDNNMIEEIAPVIFWSMKEGEEGKLTISTLVPPLIREKKRLLTMQVDLLKEGGKEFNLVYYRELKSAQVRLLLVSEELAKKGISPLINTLVRDPDISQRLFLVVVKGNFDDYIRHQLLKQENLDYFIYRMFKHYESKNQGEMTVVNLHQFVKRLYSPFVYPIVLVFRASSENFTYDGTAFFRHDKLVASIKKMDDQIFQLLNNRHYLKLFPIPDLSVSMGHVRAKVRKEFDRDYSSLSVKVDLDGRIEEYSGNKSLFVREDLDSLNREIETYLEKQTIALLKNMQQWKTDPLQLGTLTLKPFSQPISEQEWLHHWEQMKIDVDYQIHFLPLRNVMQ